MVLSRNDKRKRKEGDLVDLMEPLSESPKRTKVHAQRKFAQGATTVFSSAQTPVKDKEKTKPAVMTELITHKRPNTEDFLTYLCFRGTSILPPSLNFFNVGSKKEKQETKPVRAAMDKNSSLSSTSTETLKSDTSQKPIAKVKTVMPEKKKVPNSMQKNISKFKTATSTVQALKKKYQEQRLAKQRIKNKFKATCVMRTRSCTERAILKTGTKLAPRKFLPRIPEPKRHGLRSGVLVDKTNKHPPKSKVVPTKPKKKISQKVSKDSDSSNSVTTSEEEEELPSEKSELQSQKRSTQKNVSKKICTRSKSEMRRITRSHTGTISPKNLPRRPTRKTKEAAAVYMEILGRKLVSPDLENEDNLSVESFPELPNARKVSQAEGEIKAKVKQIPMKSLSKIKECKVDSVKVNLSQTTNNKRMEKTKSSKMIFKCKTVKVQRYSEVESDEESTSSVETNNTRPVTRRSLGKVNKPAVRNLRSSTKSINTKTEVQTNLTAKTASNNQQHCLKTTKEKFVMKRKREQILRSVSSDKVNATKQKDVKAQENSIIESDEETLGMLLNKMKKKKENIEEEKLPVEGKKTDNKKVLESEGTQNVKQDLSKVSDDEESFRGFTKKAISKVLNSCQTRVTANLLKTEETEDKSDSFKVSEKLVSNTVTKLEENKEKSENKNQVSSRKSEADACSLVIQEEKSNTGPGPGPDPDPEPEPDLDPDPDLVTTESAANLEQKCEHETEESSNVIDIPLSTVHLRKERVNMSTEQIEKWLNESSLAKEESKLEMENVTGFRYDATSTTEKVKTDVSHLSISTKIQHLVRPVNVTLAKLAEKSNVKDRVGIQNKNGSIALDASQIANTKPQVISPNKSKLVSNPRDLKDKEFVKIRNNRAARESSVNDDSDTVSKSDHNSVDGSLTDKKSPLERKPIFQPRKPFLPKVKERKAVTPNANAFSPENESSVYAFESDTEQPVSTPFRRKNRELTKPTTSITPETIKENQVDNQMCNKNSDDTFAASQEKPTKLEKIEKEAPAITDNLVQESNDLSNLPLGTTKFELPKNLTNLTNVQVLPLDKLTTTWSNVNCSASIAVQVNLDDNIRQEPPPAELEDINQQKSTEISTQTENNNENDDDNDGQLFYIPLQAVTRNGPNLVQGQQLIQGVAVKLGTEGPTGPHQRVLLKAKLVTKPPLSVARCPPVGTVQPTTRTPPNSSTTTTTATETSVASTSSSSSLAVVPAAAVTSNTEHSESSSTKSNNTSNINRQNATSGSSNAVEKLMRSPKSSRERKASIDSTKSAKKPSNKSKQRVAEIYSPTNNTIFPSTKNKSDDARLVEAPTFHPSEKDFQDPLEYIDKIRPVAEKFGICRVVPPPNFKPECKVSDDMRFTAYNQYVHRMLHRWGPNVKEMMAIKKYLATQSITLTHPPWIGGMEVDLPHLYQTVQSLGGLKEVIEKKKWQKVADGMKIPKSAQDRVTKLDDIYCKYLLPYDTLSPEERGKLFDEVESEWTKREKKALQRQEASSNDNDDEDDDESSEEIEECIVKGRNMPLNAFYRIARNTQRMWFGENQRSGNESEGASADEVEAAFWKHVAERKRHVCVHAASIDSSGRGFGFSVAKNSPFARHPWNLKVLTNNAGSILRALGPLMGVTVPTLHVGMLFSACCWYRDPHGLPWIEYLHTGAKKIWYGIPDEHNNNFRDALSKMVPRYCKNKTIWLPSDTAMVPPELLVSNGVPLCQTVQEPGQFIIVFPKAFTSSICTGYVVSESVYFAQSSWLDTAEQVFKDIQDSCEPSIFSFERLLFNIINDSRSHIDVLKQILPSVIKIREREIENRKKLEQVGLTSTERLPLPDSGKRRKGKKVKEDDGDFECETCRANLFVSLVNNSQDDSVYCLLHAVQLLIKKKHFLKHCTLMYTYSEDELDELIQKLEDRIEAKSKKTNQIKQAK